MRTAPLCTALSVILAFSAPGLRADDAPPASQPSPVDYHKLKDQMPQTLAGLKRTHLEGSKMKFGPTSMTTAKADYGGEEGQLAVHIEVMDYANADMVKGLAAWSQMEVDNENDDGFQKTVKLQNQPAMLEYNSKDKTGTISVMTSGLIIKTTLENATAEQFKAVQDALPIKGLTSLRQ